MKNKIFGLLCFLMFIHTPGFTQQKISVSTLLEEMTDRKRLARFPAPAYTCKQFSSYDRSMVSPEQPGWFGNADRSMFIRTEQNKDRREFVMMDTQGPGAIVRFWMTFAGENSGQGIMRIYIDGNPVPVIEGSPYSILSGNALCDAPLATSVSSQTPYENRGHNLYFPIPYAKHCKVTYESDKLSEEDPGAHKPETECVYYHINYRTYDAGTQVASYTPADLIQYKRVIEKAQTRLQKKDQNTEKSHLKTVSLNVDLAPGENRSFQIEGACAIQLLRLQLKAKEMRQALRSTVMSIAFDGQKTVWSPLGDFFGIGYLPLATNTWFNEITANGLMNSYWIMPFQRECTITFTNLGDQPVSIENAEAGYNHWKWDNRSMYFNALWQQYTHHYVGKGDDAVDVNYIFLNGKGVYVGDALSVCNAANAWWGEGDEKIYIDGEAFPSHAGTGTEDYYGYAWCRKEPFTGHPFIAQPIGEGNYDPGYTVNSRVRVLDAIPFTHSLQFDMEIWHWLRSRINFAPVAYWYMLPGSSNSHYKEDVAGAQEPVAFDKQDIYSPQLSLFIEGENLRPISCTSGKVEPQFNIKGIWSDDMQLVWKEIKNGSKATFEFNSQLSGCYLLTMQLTQSPLSAQFSVSLNGQMLSPTVDLYCEKISVKQIQMGKILLKEGINTLTIEQIAPNPKGQLYEFGLDYLKFR